MSTEDIICDEANGNGKLMKQLNNYIIVDVGANLTNKKFSRDLDAVIQRAKDSGTSWNYDILPELRFHIICSDIPVA